MKTMRNGVEVELTEVEIESLLAQQAIDSQLMPKGPRLPDLEPDQFWFALRFFGYDQALHDWIDSLKDPASPTYDLVAWAVISAKVEFAKYFERDHPFVEEARQALGIPAEQMDAMWQYGGG